MRERPWIVYGAVALIFLLILLWSPTDSDRGIWGTLVLAALVALGVWALRRQTLKEFPPAPS
jgi:Na+/melibiose symporter-like transporter